MKRIVIEQKLAITGNGMLQQVAVSCEEKWKTSLAIFFDTVPLNPVTMFNGVVHSGSPFRSNFTTAISSNNECSSPNVENLSIVRNAIRDDNLFDAVKEFYNSHELSLRGCLMDWMENTIFLPRAIRPAPRKPACNRYQIN